MIGNPPPRPRGRQFVGRTNISSGTMDLTAALTGGIAGRIQPRDLCIIFGLRTNQTLPSPSPATGWSALFTDYSNATPWQVIGWYKTLDGTETDPMPTTHTKLLLAYRNCAIGTVSTPLTGTGTTASVPALSTSDWSGAFIASRASQADMDGALVAAGLTTRRELANGTDNNSHAYADGSGGFAQINQTVSTGAWFGVSFSLVRT